MFHLYLSKHKKNNSLLFSGSSKMPPHKQKKLTKSSELEMEHTAELEIIPFNNWISKNDSMEMEDAFKDLVSWVLKNESEQFRASLENIVYKELTLFIKCIDAKTGYTLHEIVAIKGNVEIMNAILLKSKQSKSLSLIHREENYLEEAIEFAIMHNHLEIVKCIFSHDNYYRFHARRFLSHALQKRNLDIFRFILDTVIKSERVLLNGNIEGRWNCHVLLEAAGKNELDFIKILIEAKTNPCVKSNYSFTPLHRAVKSGNLQVIKYLVENGASLFIRDEDEKNPLDHAKGSIQGTQQDEIIEYLTSQMRSVLDSIDLNHSAMLDESWECQKTLNIKEQADFKDLISFTLRGNVNGVANMKYNHFFKNNSVDLKTGFRSIDFAAFQGHLNCVIHMIKMGASVEVTSKCDKTRIIQSASNIAISKNHQDIVNYLSMKTYKMKTEIKLEEGAESFEDEKDLPSTSTGEIQMEDIPDFETSEASSSPVSKSRKIVPIVKQEPIESFANEEAEQNSTNVDEIAFIVQPMIKVFLNKTISYSGKMLCLSAIETILSKESTICKFISKKEVINEIAILVTDIVSKDENTQSKDFEPIGKILCKINATENGKKLINEMKLSFGAFERLKKEMRKYEFDPDAAQAEFVFES